jgi:hypothetical protein
MITIGETTCRRQHHASYQLSVSVGPRNKAWNIGTSVYGLLTAIGEYRDGVGLR